MEHSHSKRSLTEELKQYSGPSNGALHDHDSAEDDDEDDNRSSIADGDVAIAIDDGSTDQPVDQVGSSIVLKQIRRLSSVEPTPPPPLPPPLPPVSRVPSTKAADQKNNKPKKSNQ